MSESVNIAELALDVSKRVFETFGWEILGPFDENFQCHKVEKHKTKGAKEKHPVDCVFTYPDPFQDRSIYLLTDLKSYAATTIASTDFAPYIRGLTKAVDCAVISTEWRRRYIMPQVTNWLIDGLLFVYNHDHGYDKDFRLKARGLAPSSLEHPSNSRIHLVGTDTVNHLTSVCLDIKRIAAERNLPYRSRRFFFGQQLLNMPRESLLPYATVEILRSSMQIINLSDPTTNESHFNIYLRCEGTIEEFDYVVTYLFRNGIVNLATTISISGGTFSHEAAIHFDYAKMRFLERHYRMKEIKYALDRIKFERMAIVTTNFSGVDESKRRAKAL